MSWILMILDLLGPSVALRSMKLATIKAQPDRSESIKLLPFGETAFFDLA